MKTAQLKQFETIVREAPSGASSRLQDMRAEQITNSRQLADLAAYLLEKPQEHVVVYAFDAMRHPLGFQVIGIGTATSALYDIPQIFRFLFNSGAVYWAIVHNHPSGSVGPSTADRTMTRRMARAGALLGMPLTDSLIVGKDGGAIAGYFSFRDREPQLWENLELN